MNVEQRLHHAAHEIRELDIEVPPFVAPSPGPGPLRRSIPILAMSMVMFLGLAVLASRPEGGVSAPTEPIAAAVMPSDDVSATVGTPPEVVPQLTPREEVAMISSLASGASRAAAGPADLRIPTGVS